MSKAYLILENGRVFEGTSFGKVGKTLGEVVFNTGMVGYLETLTDKNNFGQIVVQTFPMIGNYGVIDEDFESSGTTVAGYVAREVCSDPSNFRCQGLLEQYLEKEAVVGICGIDTRALTRIIREEGVMNGMITDCPDVTDEVLEEIKNFKTSNPVQSVKCENKVESTPLSKYTVALYDFGCNKSIIDAFLHLDCEVHIFNCDSTAEEILSCNPCGVIISDGPGNPKDITGATQEIKKLCDKKIPMFGIGLGHQLIALAKGGDTYKLLYGHRGSSGPCKNLETGALSIITQNHGYCVSKDSLPAGAEISYENANDGTIEGLTYTDIPAFSVQFRPAFSKSAVGEKSIYELFVDLIKEEHFNAVK